MAFQFNADEESHNRVRLPKPATAPGLKTGPAKQATRSWKRGYLRQAFHGTHRSLMTHGLFKT